jgi:hydroxyacylglutathione hydrolase
MARVGYQNIQGYLEGGFEAWTRAGRAVDTIPNISAGEFVNHLGAGFENARVLDVRRVDEYADGAVEGSLNVPLAQINEGMESIPRHTTLYIHCASGYRSVIAASILKVRGYDRIVNIEGGYKAIEALLVSGGVR